MADTIEIIQGTATTIEIAGLQGPQGPAGATGGTGAAGQGVPVGGSTGQILRKASGTNYDTEWATGGGGGGVSSWNDLSDKPATFPPSSHTHAISEVTSLQTSLDGKAATSHSHSISDVTGLQTSLDAKAASSHTHAISDITSLQTSLDGKSATGHTHLSSAVTDFSAAASAAAPVQSVAGRTGAVTLAVADVSGAVSTSDSRLSDERPDNTFRIVGSSDATKKVAFEVDGIGTGTVRTLSVADASGTLGWLQSVSSITVSSTHQLTAARNQRVLVNNTASAGTAAAIFYPTSGNSEGDRLEVVHASQATGTIAINVRAGLYDYTGSQSINLGYQRTFIYVAGSWTAGSVEQHTHPDPTPSFASSDFRVTEGSPTKQLAFSLADITVGATRILTVPNSSGTIALTSQLGGGTKTYAVFTAGDNQPPSTAFATLDTRNSIAVLDYDAATDENAVFVGIMPEAASLGSGLIVRLHWMATSATSGNVRWGVQFERSNTDLDSDSFAAAVEANGAANGTSGIITTTAITVTDFDGITAGDVFRLKVFRNADDATNDTMTGDAELIAVEIRSAA
jgi:hypothetical protein